MENSSLPSFLYTPIAGFTNPTEAVIVLPEIFGLNAHTKRVVDIFSAEFQIPAFGLDFFYVLTKQPNDFDYETGRDQGVALMQEMTGELFLKIFDEALNTIKQMYPSVVRFTVCGFCFGGKLAYLSDVRSEIVRVISFYGPKVHLPFYISKSVIEAVTTVRPRDANLQIFGLYGSQDSSIPENDRLMTKQAFADANIHYTDILLDAGHAFFNADRAQYVEKAANEAWAEVQGWMNIRK